MNPKHSPIAARNFTSAEEEAAAAAPIPGYDGPDIHPTPEDCAGHGASSE